jgi:hypothetical protein
MKELRDQVSRGEELQVVDGANDQGGSMDFNEDVMPDQGWLSYFFSHFCYKFFYDQCAGSSGTKAVIGIGCIIWSELRLIPKQIPRS